MRVQRSFTLRSWALCALIAVPACRVGQDYSKPDVLVPDQWTETANAGPIDERWWQAFHDPKLDDLVERALKSNLDLGIATARVREARAVRAAIAGQWDPQVEGFAGVARGKPSANASGGAASASTRNLFEAGFDARWEIDVFGRRVRALEAADAEVDIAVESLHDAQVSLLGEVARNYVEVRGLQRQIALTQQNLTSQQDTAHLTEVRYGAGLSTDLDVARAQGLAASTQADIPALEGRVRASMHALSVLLGESPGPIAQELETPTELPAPPETIAAGLPAELVRRRPDVRRAERELARAVALTGEATADLYPTFSLTGSIGKQSDSLSSLLDADSSAWSVGGGLTAPIFNGGTLRANVEAADSRALQAELAYRRTVLSALAEVETAFSDVAKARARHESLVVSVDAYSRAVKLATELNQRGIRSFFEVLDAQQQLFRTQSLEALSATDLTADTVALYKALGGGWETQDAADSQPGE
jgi:NodT family efflux transporter outer membrane factor (OMF) lipoprotein